MDALTVAVEEAPRDDAETQDHTERSGSRGRAAIGIAKRVNDGYHPTGEPSTRTTLIFRPRMPERAALPRRHRHEVERARSTNVRPVVM